MMTLLAKGLGWLFGSKLLPLGLTGALLLTGHQLWLARDRRIEVAATAKCETGWELAKAKAERDQARQQLEQTKAAHIQEQQTTEELRHDRQKIAAEFEAHKASASADPRCLSDGVLKLLGVDGGVAKAR